MSRYESSSSEVCEFESLTVQKQFPSYVATFWSSIFLFAAMSKRFLHSKIQLVSTPQKLVAHNNAAHVKTRGFKTV